MRTETIWEGYAGVQDCVLLPFVSLLDVQGGSELQQYKSPGLTNDINFPHCCLFNFTPRTPIAFSWEKKNGARDMSFLQQSVPGTKLASAAPGSYSQLPHLVATTKACREKP